MLSRRLVQLYAGLALYGTSMALMLRADLGLDPWDVLHQGVADRTGMSFGTVAIVTGAAVLLLWVPLRQRPGFGTVSNVVVIGLAVDAALAVLPVPASWVVRAGLLVSGVVLNGVATGLYIGARLGPGPRDGLMTGLVRRTGRPVRLVRTALEASVLVVGWLLGGTVGIGTVAYALAIGPLVQVFLPLCTVPVLTPVRDGAASPRGLGLPRRVRGGLVAPPLIGRPEPAADEQGHRAPHPTPDHGPGGAPPAAAETSSFPPGSRPRSRSAAAASGTSPVDVSNPRTIERAWARSAAVPRAGSAASAAQSPTSYSARTVR